MGSPTPLKKNSSHWQASEAGLHGGGQQYPPCAVFTVVQGERAMKRQDQSCGPPTEWPEGSSKSPVWETMQPMAPTEAELKQFHQSSPKGLDAAAWSRDLNATFFLTQLPQDWNWEGVG